jgi:putative endonuclease
MATHPAGAARRPEPVTRREIGRRGEEAAVAALRRLGYRIVERNVRLRRGELDVIADDHGVLVFVEIKARRSSRCGTPAEAVTARKRRALVALASAYLVRSRWTERPCRFDVAEVWIEQDGRPPRVEILHDAFGA